MSDFVTPGNGHLTRLPLRPGTPCQTPDGPGTVRQIRNATRWQPAWILVELDSGGSRVFQAGRVEALAAAR